MADPSREDMLCGLCGEQFARRIRDFIVDDCRAVLHVAMIRIRARRFKRMSRAVEQPPKIPPIGSVFFDAAFVPVIDGASHLRCAKTAGPVNVEQYLVPGFAAYLLFIKCVKVNRQFAPGIT